MYSTIHSTRRGFLYQDRFTILTYLDFLKNKTLKEFYIDYPLPRQESLDIRIIDNNEREIVYEIKTGEKFKLDQKFQIRDALRTLENYSLTNGSEKLNLVISKGLRNKIAEYWQKLMFIKNHSYSTPQAKKNVKWLFDKIKPLRNIKNDKELYELCKKINIDDCLDDQNIKNNKFCDIDNLIISKIDYLSSKFGANVCDIEYPSEILMFNLFHLCRECAGTAKNTIPIFNNIITNFLTHRIFLDDNYAPKTGRGRSREDINREVNNNFSRWLDNLATTAADSQTISEGKTINE